MIAQHVLDFCKHLNLKIQIRVTSGEQQHILNFICIGFYKLLILHSILRLSVIKKISLKLNIQLEIKK